MRWGVEQLFSDASATAATEGTTPPAEPTENGLKQEDGGVPPAPKAAAAAPAGKDAPALSEPALKQLVSIADEVHSLPLNETPVRPRVVSSLLIAPLCILLDVGRFLVTFSRHAA